MATNDKTQNRFKKRKNDHTDTDTDSEPEQLPNETSWPRFLVISSKGDDQSLGRLSPFAISKAIKGLAGDPKEVKVLRSGKILVECAKRQQSDNLLRSKLFANIPIEVSPHQSLNFSKGVVRSRDLRNSSEEEMLEHLKEQNVIEVKRISITRNGNKIQTNTFILKFNVSTPPPRIIAGYLSIPVEPYVPNPLRCFNCQRFGHHKDKCINKSVCARCGQEGHDPETCENPLQCPNCKGDHLAYSKECPRWQQEKEIQSVKVRENVTFVEARRRVEARVPIGPSASSYADAVRAPRVETVSVGVQTTISWPHGSPNYKKLPDASSSSQLLKNKEKPAKETKNTSSQSNRKNSKTKEQEKLPKGMRDPIQVHNKFVTLDADMESEVESDSSPDSPSKKKNKKKINKITPP